MDARRQSTQEVKQRKEESGEKRSMEKSKRRWMGTEGMLIVGDDWFYIFSVVFAVKGFKKEGNVVKQKQRDLRKKQSPVSSQNSKIILFTSLTASSITHLFNTHQGQNFKMKASATCFTTLMSNKTFGPMILAMAFIEVACRNQNPCLTSVTARDIFRLQQTSSLTWNLP
ncbi:hypothetical protein VNO77_21228 [Canavalia gladiata]|uniref:Uncharacterized protein n=1 Tax=Canavalia gladiata TaxID=3824 RepID=A0AAN9LVA1_CANGL